MAIKPIPRKTKWIERKDGIKAVGNVINEVQEPECYEWGVLSCNPSYKKGW